MAIRDWPASERPREKLLQKGEAALSDAELLAIFLRTGITGKSALDLARDILQEFGSLSAVLQADQTAFCRCKGLGIAKFVQLQASLEMSRRYLFARAEKSDALTSPDSVRDYISLKLRKLGHEMFVCLFLDNKHRVIEYQEMFRGTLSSANVYPREVVKACLAVNAAAVIFAHNHPSGVAEPSEADICLTERLKEALALIDVRVLDHLVVGEGVAVSFAERGLV
ncbi:MAG: DNA repair protein RadC [Gammaproteobacteria bacterium]|nr:DNA repair protein RadC [Gammaproteobacteria bacterium]